MSNPIIPAATTLAAQRGFIRTAAQSLASVIPTSAIAIALSADWVLGVGLGVAGAVVTALLAGTASALSIISNGIPTDYADVTLVKQSVLAPDEAVADVDAAVQRVLLRRDLRTTGEA
ncbi:MAG: hypothetical protein QM630_01685 [Microbacterium sp.]